MKKEKVLVRDQNEAFLKIFRKDLVNEFHFVETSLKDNKTEFIDINRFVYVVYNKSELLEFLNLEKRGSIILMCLFSEQLYGNSSFIEEIFDLITLNGFKTKREAVKDLKTHFKITPQSKFIGNSSVYTSKNKVQFHGFFKTILFFV